MSSVTTFKVLLVEDDKEDVLLISDLRPQMKMTRITLQWQDSYETGLEAILTSSFDACLLDFHLGDRNGLEFLREAIENGCETPIIFLTGVGGSHLDQQAMLSGAADYLPKEELSASSLERSIRHAIEIWKSKAELRKLASKLFNAQEEERKRLASELHDSIAPTLAALKSHVEMTVLLKNNGALSAAVNHLGQFVPLLQRSIDEIRKICNGLRPPMLDDLGLLTSIDWMRKEFMKLYPTIFVEFDPKIEEEAIQERLKLSIFRIAQEALNNVAKHSGAEWVDIGILKNEGHVNLIIVDDGIGMDSSSGKPSRTLGLIGMRERAELTGGSLSIKSAPGNGTAILASWPIEGSNCS